MIYEIHFESLQRSGYVRRQASTAYRFSLSIRYTHLAIWFMLSYNVNSLLCMYISLLRAEKLSFLLYFLLRTHSKKTLGQHSPETSPESQA